MMDKEEAWIPVHTESKIPRWIKAILYKVLKKDMVYKLSRRHGEQFIDDVMKTFEIPTNLMGRYHKMDASPHMVANNQLCEVIDTSKVSFKIIDDVTGCHLIPLSEFTWFDILNCLKPKEELIICCNHDPENLGLYWRHPHYGKSLMAVSTFSSISDLVGESEKSY